MVRCIITDNVADIDICLWYPIKMLVFNQVCLALDRQLLIVEATINDSVSGDDIRFSYYVKMLIYCQVCLML